MAVREAIRIVFCIIHDFLAAGVASQRAGAEVVGPIAFLVMMILPIITTMILPIITMMILPIIIIMILPIIIILWFIIALSNTGFASFWNDLDFMKMHLHMIVHFRYHKHNHFYHTLDC